VLPGIPHVRRLNRKRDQSRANPILDTFAGCCAWVIRNGTRARAISQTPIIDFLAIRPCLLRFIPGCPAPFSLPVVHRIWHSSQTSRGYPWTQTKLLPRLVTVALTMPASAKAWNIPGHMLFAAIAYQVLRQRIRRYVPLRHKPDRMSYADLVIVCHETSNSDFYRTL
jgi:hypothetical protein